MIAPLDWGLGHATRCIPIIDHLLKSGCEIIFAGPSVQQLLLKKEFPNLQTVELKGYNITYTKSKRFFSFKILMQIPKILIAIRRENRQLKTIIETYVPNLVISDNRYGLHNTTVPCIFITHQLNILAPCPFLEKIIQTINYRYINRFSQCWVPDYEGKLNIAGRLSHPEKLPRIQIKYMGPLSRFKFVKSGSYKYKFLFLLSGPEPQRTILEQKVLSAIIRIDAEVLLVRGKPGDSDVSQTENCTIFNHLETSELQTKIAESEFVVGRSGYTTVMEILLMQKKSLLIPTPGQTEQEYLAQHLFGQQWCYTCKQDDDLLKHINHLNEFNFKMPAFEKSSYAKVMNESLNELFEQTSQIQL